MIEENVHDQQHTVKVDKPTVNSEQPGVNINEPVVNDILLGKKYIKIEDNLVTKLKFFCSGCKKNFSNKKNLDQKVFEKKF